MYYYCRRPLVQHLISDRATSAVIQQGMAITVQEDFEDRERLFKKGQWGWVREVPYDGSGFWIEIAGDSSWCFVHKDDSGKLKFSAAALVAKPMYSELLTFQDPWLQLLLGWRVNGWGLPSCGKFASGPNQ